MRYCPLFALFVLLFSVTYTKATNTSLQDSLFQSVHSLRTPPQQADSLNEWAWNFQERDPEIALFFAEEALRISQKSHYLKGEGDAYKRIGQIQRIRGKTSQSLYAYQSALALKKQEGDTIGEAIILGNIGNIYYDQRDNTLARRYFREALQINLSLGATKEAVQQYNGIGNTHDDQARPDSAIVYYRKAAELAVEIEIQELRNLWLARAWNNLGSPFKTLGDLDSARFYWELSRKAFESLDGDPELADPLNNLGVMELDLGNAQIALDSFFSPALAIAYNAENLHQAQDILNNISQAYEQLHHPDSALHYLKAYQTLHDTLFNQEKSHDIATLETRYQVKEKDAANALLQSETQSKTIVITAISIIAALLTGLAALFIYYQRKRLKTQQELSQRKQKEDALRIVELVQTQELRSLEALVEGQETERNRMATELHDGLGSLLATVKLYFNQLDKVDPTQQPALKKADHLLDEACQEVRRYSHDLAGLPVVQFGLLNAVRDLADSISGAGKLQVRVYAHQMEERLSLPLERTIYKVIQELLTNVIKHAQASEVTIQLSRHADNLNIILEDNGKGMNPKLHHQAAGLGLRSVKARLETLGGEFTLDSNPGHGTTALIDIPLKEEYHD